MNEDEDLRAHNERKASKMAYMDRKKKEDMAKRARWAADEAKERAANGYGGSRSRSKSRARTKRTKTRSMLSRRSKRPKSKTRSHRRK